MNKQFFIFMDFLFIFLVLIAFLVITALCIVVHRMKERIDSLELAQYNIVEQFNEHKVKYERTALYVGKHQAYIEDVQKKKMQKSACFLNTAHQLLLNIHIGILEKVLKRCKFALL